jgi:HNH endonuclease
MEEIWETVPSYPRLEASSEGRVRPKTRIGEMPHGGPRIYSSEGTFGTLRRSKKTAKHFYSAVQYRDYGNLKVHRLVCEAFHGPAQFERAGVTHLDFYTLNNKPENLKWATHQESTSRSKLMKLGNQKYPQVHQHGITA